MSADLPGGDVTDLQTLRKCTSVRNNPVNLMGSSGVCPNDTAAEGHFCTPGPRKDSGAICAVDGGGTLGLAGAGRLGDAPLDGATAVLACRLGVRHAGSQSGVRYGRLFDRDLRNRLGIALPLGKGHALPLYIAPAQNVELVRPVFVRRLCSESPLRSDGRAPGNVAGPERHDRYLSSGCMDGDCALHCPPHVKTRRPPQSAATGVDVVAAASGMLTDAPGEKATRSTIADSLDGRPERLGLFSDGLLALRGRKYSG
jgi:hypothetical protein